MKKKKLCSLLLASAFVLTSAMTVAFTACKPGGNSASTSEDLKVTKIELDTSGVKTTFAFDEAFSYEGLKVTATMSDNSTQSIDPNDCRITEPSTTNPGTRNVTVSYQGQTARYQITVQPKVIPEISATSLLDILEENESNAYRVEAENIDMATPGVKKGEGVTSFVADAPVDADITSGDKYLTGFNVKWNYFGFTFTAAAEYTNVTIVLRLSNSGESTVNVGECMNMFLNYTDTDGEISGGISLENYTVPAGEHQWKDVVLRNQTIPQGTNKLTFEILGDQAPDIDYIDFYVGSRYINSLVEITEQTTLTKELEDFDTEKAKTRADVAAAHGLKDGELFVENVTKEWPDGIPTSGGKSVGAIAQGSQMSTTLRLAKNATVKINFLASAVGKGKYCVKDHWNFTIDGIPLQEIENVNIEGGDGGNGFWWEWIPTSLGVYNLPAGDHLFLVETVGTDCNVDCFTFEVISYDGYDESGSDLNNQTEEHECQHVCPVCGKCTDPACEDPACAEKCEGHAVTLSATETVRYEAETWGNEGVVTRQDFIDAGILQPGQYKTEDGNGQTCICAFKDGTVFTLKFNAPEAMKVAVAIVGAGGGDLSSTMSFTMDGTAATSASGSLATADGAGGVPSYWNWTAATIGTFDLTAGEHTLVITIVSGQPNIDCVTFTPVTDEPGPGPDVPEVHECQHVCPICNKCTDATCEDPVCAEKCEGHEDPVVKYDATLSTSEAVRSEAETWGNEGVVTRQDFVDAGILQPGTYATGEGFIYGFSESTFTLKINVPEAMRAKIEIVGRDGGSTSVTLDGTKIGEGIALPSPSTTHAIGIYELTAGEHTLVIVGAANYDCVIFTPASETEELYDATLSATEAVRSEAETWGNEGVVSRQDFVDAGRVQAGQYLSEAGNGQTCICGFDSGTVFTLKINAPEAMKVEIAIVGAGGGDLSSTMSFTMDGEEVTTASGSLATTDGEGGVPSYWNWTPATIGTFDLTAGEHTLVITIVSGHPNIDCVTFTPVTAE